MEEFSLEQADALAEALRRIASKIERGYPISEKQQQLIVKLSREILFKNQPKKTEYQFKKTKPKRLVDEEDISLD